MQLLSEVAQERGTYLLAISFFSDRGEAVVPSSATWTLRDGGGAVINSRDRVVIGSLAATKTIALSGLDLRMDSGAERELRHFVLEWTYGDGRTVKEEIRFWVAAVAGI